MDGVVLCALLVIVNRGNEAAAVAVIASACVLFSRDPEHVVFGMDEQHGVLAEQWYYC